jgi:uncharacterized protein HemX
MSESRPNQAGQAGMAVLIIVILIGGLFLGAGGLTWMWIRAAHAQRAAEVEAQYQEQVARERMEAAARMAEDARRAKQETHDRDEAVSAAPDAATIEGNEPVPAEDGSAQTP